MPNILPLSSAPVSAQAFGGKAAGLALLRRFDFPVPDALLVEVCRDPGQLDACFHARLTQALALFPQENGRRYVAVRSSCTGEDDYDSSQAGQFRTILGHLTDDEILRAVRQVVSDLAQEDDGAQMGVVIQAGVDADYSGVLFSSDPITYAKNSVVLSYTSGTGEALVSGHVSGWDVMVTDGQLLHRHGPMAGQLLLTLARQCKALEARLGYPIDVEWAVKDGAVFYLQCRPLASITGVKGGLYPICASALAGLPQSLLSHDKVRIRLAAQQAGVLISSAWIRVGSHCAHGELPLSQPPRTPLCSGYSAVLLYPRLVNGKVLRSFVGDCHRAEDYLARHAGRQLCSAPQHTALDDCLAEYDSHTQASCWLTATILQEIFHPLYTGVIRRTPDGCVAELTRGHFLTKGVVPTSQYVLSPSGQVLRRQEVSQSHWFEIIEGHVLSCTDENAPPVSLPDDVLGALYRTFAPFLLSDRVVEFGILDGAPLRPYLIDYVEEDPRSELTAADLSLGILSRGQISGVVRRLNEDARDGLNVHLYDAAHPQAKCRDKTVFLCPRPNIALLPLLEQYAPDCLGFVFEDGSVLCHFAVVLRERGIPAVKLNGQLPPWPDGCLCHLDAASAKLTGKERISLA